MSGLTIKGILSPESSLDVSPSTLRSFAPDRTNRHTIGRRVNNVYSRCKLLQEVHPEIDLTIRPVCCVSFNAAVDVPARYRSVSCRV